MAGCLQYDAESRQTGYTPTGTSYAYDGDGRRVIVTANGVNTVFVYDALGNLAAKYTSGVGGATPCTICYLSWDHLGSTRMVTDQAGNLVARHDYLPFGEEIRNGQAGRPANGVWGGLDSVSQKFTGKERDSESGLDYFGARYYGATLGRFLSVDPGNAGADLTNPQSWNAYAYVLNNPSALIDPTGACSFDSNGNAVDDAGGACYSDSSGGTSITVSGDTPAPVMVSDSGFSYQSLYSGSADFSATGYARTPSSVSSQQPGNNGTISRIASTMRCAANTANNFSLAALLPAGTPTLISNIFSNDFSTYSNILTGPDRWTMSNAGSVLEGRGLNTAVRGIGKIPYTTSGLRVAFNGAGTPQAVGNMTRQIAESALGKAAGTLIGTASGIKFSYDLGSYAVALGYCTVE